MELVIRQTRVGATPVLQLSGEVDLATLPRLADALMRFAVEAIVAAVDVDGVHVMDDTALGLLLGAAGRARQAGGDIVVICNEGLLRDRLALTGFDRAVRVADRIAALH